MDKKKIIDAIEKAKTKSKKRNFAQSIDIIVNLKGFDIKKDKFEEFVALPQDKGKKQKICALVGPELLDQAKKLCDLTISNDEFSKYDKLNSKKLARDYDFFIAQANLMPEIAKVFGKYLSPNGKMPNPKAGQIIPPKANIEPLVKRLKNTLKLTVKKSPVIQCSIGNESIDTEKIADNALFLLDQLENKLLRGKENINSILFKTTMGGIVRLD